jgi:hypothetical protein
LLHDRLRAQWTQNNLAPWELRTVQGLRIQLSQSPQDTSLMKSVPLGMEAVLRLAFDYSVDHDDHEDSSLLPDEWWPAVRVLLPDGSQFAPWPAISWPTLWEWEELQEGWKGAFRKARSLELAGKVDTTILDTLANWLFYAFSQCASRHEVSRSYFKISPSTEEWEKAVPDYLRAAEISGSKFNPSMGLSRFKELLFGSDKLCLFATPESGLSTEACQGILESQNLTVDNTVSKLNRLRIQRLLDAGIPEAKARLALDTLDREHPEHPWVQAVGSFQLPASTAQD